MRAFILSLSAFLAGTLIVYVALVAGVLTVWEMSGFQDREGAGSMGLIFIIGPLISLPAGLVVAIIVWFRVRRTKKSASAI